MTPSPYRLKGLLCHPFRTIAAWPFLSRQFLWLVFAILLTIWLAFSYFVISGKWWNQYPISLSGFIAIIAGIIYSSAIDFDQLKALRQLHHATIIRIDESSWKNIQQNLAKKSFLCQIITVIGLSVVMASGYSFWYLENYAFQWDLIVEDIEFIIMSACCTVLVSCRIGRIAAHAFFGKLIAQDPTFNPIAEHPDGAGGLSRIGHTCLWQASALLIPALWLVIWLWVMSECNSTLSTCQQYKTWKGFFIALLFVEGVIIWPICIVASLWCFHTAIVKWKTLHVEPLVSITYRELLRIRDQNLYRSKEQEIRELSDRLYKLHSFLNWPFCSSDLRRVFLSIIMPFMLIVMATLFNSVVSPGAS